MRTKKNLTKPLPARQPTPDEIDTFVRGGGERDTEQHVSVSTDIRTSVKSGTSRLTVDLPRAQHLRFKIACTVAGAKMNDEIRRFIDRRCVELETSADAERTR